MDPVLPRTSDCSCFLRKCSGFLNVVSVCVHMHVHACVCDIRRYLAKFFRKTVCSCDQTRYGFGISSDINKSSSQKDSYPAKKKKSNP